MRRNKAQRQEAKRERGFKLRRPVKKDDSQEPERFVIVEREDVRILKYAAQHDPFGFTPEHAARLAEPVPDQRPYEVVPVAVFKWARAQGRPMTVREALRDFVPEQEGDGE